MLLVVGLLVVNFAIVLVVGYLTAVGRSQADRWPIGLAGEIGRRTTP
ncbi:MAG: hypothetical protein WCA30_17540 [Dermatophilaceae bacterium]